MTVVITLTTAGLDSGPFNLYSNLDGYTSAFETGVSRVALLAGYSSSLVPDFTTTIRVISTGVCTNYIDIPLYITTTTTTTTPEETLYTTEMFVNISSLVSGVDPEILIVIPFNYFETMTNIIIGQTLPSPTFDLDGFYAIADNATDTDNSDYRIFEVVNNIVISRYNHLGVVE